ncbi:PHB depolymerase family esterase [Caulobacter sp. S45]|uniref:extracellular catalytic domain type 1 short-chain-length polyhydroxyalkanoate depolymerase n=1 Tax=Caulobacter sp. S45 TaxID=1641861 RepID=UPI0015751366|nr:PHB depolymerase family esterase [Caulobacter sp. S45]
MASLGETVAALAAARWTPADETAATSLQEIDMSADNPGGLRMLVHAPPGRPARAPLVVVLHGCTQTASAYALGAGWLELADRCGFVLLCPEQTRANNLNVCFNWFQPADTCRGGGEAASIHAMVRKAIADYDLDPSRIFVTGLSAGGAMANVMLATYPETFAGGAIIAGLPYGAASNMQEAFAAMRGSRSLPARVLGDAVRSASGRRGPWPRISIWQGDEDMTVAPSVAEDLASQWRNVHGIEGAGSDLLTAGPDDTGRRRRTAWRDSRGAAAVELNQLSGMGHGAPLGCMIDDGCGRAGPYLLEVGVSSTLEIARSWTLVQPHNQMRAAPQAPPAPARARADAGGSPPLLHAITSEVGGVITGALRNAGLLK